MFFRREVKIPSRFSTVVSAFEDFCRGQGISGVVLILCTILAMQLANSDFSYYYTDIKHTLFGFIFGQFSLLKSTTHWVNDGLMAIFFLLIGLEIKREILSGELNALNKSILPVAAAIGGMVFPALIYYFFNPHGANAEGWAIPMATDIAFAIGILALLSSRIPKSLIVLLSAIAIVDDLGAVVVIAVFYTHELSITHLIWGANFFAVLCLFNALGIRKISPYMIVGALLWFCLLKSGIHATIAGVLTALTIPSNAKYTTKDMHSVLSKVVNKLKGKEAANHTEKESILQALHNVSFAYDPPLHRLEHMLHTPVNFLIVPIFVLVNAGVALNALDLGSTYQHSISLGIMCGLIFGKIIGIYGVTAVMVFLGFAKLPTGVSLKHIFPLSLIAGIGFTMSIFIAELSFGEGSAQIDVAKLSILSASLISGVLGYAIFMFTTKKQNGSNKIEDIAEPA